MARRGDSIYLRGKVTASISEARPGSLYDRRDRRCPALGVPILASAECAWVLWAEEQVEMTAHPDSAHETKQMCERAVNEVLDKMRASRVQPLSRNRQP
jgi:hypothetical protein